MNFPYSNIYSKIEREISIQSLLTFFEALCPARGPCRQNLSQKDPRVCVCLLIAVVVLADHAVFRPAPHGAGAGAGARGSGHSWRWRCV